ncbi:MAG: NAD(P)-dependent alcohol dehydrogenase [Spirochaetes bacterium]|nr:NAD(P)-dependent alcohol dehydrogenase [Spirochaetota bacterium]
MKAAVYRRYGPPEVLRIEEVEKPVHGSTDVFIRVHATTVNRTDCGFRKPEYPLLIRPINGLFRPGKRILGNEFAGVIESTGKDVTAFRTGDRVFGLSASKFGAHAEYLVMPESGSLTIMPSKASFDEAAAVCDGLMLGINYIREIDFGSERSILINGASGSIGSACVQLAKMNGARITGVCDTRNLELVKSLGAERVIDYTKDDFTKDGHEYDVVIDAVGKSSFFKCRKLLRPGGFYFSTELGFLGQNVFLSLITPLFRGRRVGFPLPKDSREDIILFRELLDEGTYRAVIDRRYPLEEIVEATRYVESGQKAGSVVITIHG